MTQKKTWTSSFKFQGRRALTVKLTMYIFSTSSYFTCHLIREKKFVLHMIKSMGTPLCQTCIVVQITQRNYIPDNRFPHGLRSLLFRTLGSTLMIIIRGEFFFHIKRIFYYQCNNIYTSMWEPNRYTMDHRLFISTSGVYIQFPSLYQRQMVVFYEKSIKINIMIILPLRYRDCTSTFFDYFKYKKFSRFFTPLLM